MNQVAATVKSAQRRSLRRVMVGATTIVLALTACSSSDEPAADEPTDDVSPVAQEDGTQQSPSEAGGELVAVGDCMLDAALVEAAREEGSVHQMGSTIGPPQVAKMQEAMADEFGITLEVTPVRAAETLERLRTEIRTGNRTIDTVGLGVQYGVLMKQEGLSEPFFPDEIRSNLTSTAEFDEDGYWYPFQIGMYGVAVNRDLVDPADLTSWTSLSDGTIDAPMIVADPSIGSGGFTWSVAALHKEGLGEDYLMALGARENLQFGPVHADNVARLSRGEVGLYWPFGAFSLGEIGEGLQDKIELVFPGDMPYPGPHNLSLTADAPHPNAARVWMCWLMGEEGQALVVEGGQTAARAGVEAVEPRFSLDSYDEVIEPRLETVVEFQGQVETFVADYYGR